MATKKVNPLEVKNVEDLYTMSDDDLVTVIKNAETIKTDANVMQAHACRVLADEKGWTAAEIAKQTDLSASTISRYIGRGRVLHLVPAEGHRLAWPQLSQRGINDEILQAWQSELSVTPLDDRAQVLTALSTRKVVEDRLGQNADAATVEALVAEIGERRAFTPQAASNVLPSVANALDVTLPTKHREPETPDNAPTFANACRMMTAARTAIADAIADRLAATEHMEPVEISEAEAKALRDIRTMLDGLHDALDTFETRAHLVSA